MTLQIVALVGADGTGKSTQAAKLADRLRDMGYRTKRVRPLFLLFDPWRLGEGAPRGLSPRRDRLFRFANPTKVRRRTTTLRLAAGYLYAIASYAFLRTALRNADYVVCDRYFYQFFFDLAGGRAPSFARSFPRPDIAVWLDAPADVLKARLDRLPNGHETPSYLDAVVWYYRTVAPDLGFLRVDAREAKESVAERIWNQVVKGVGRFAG